MQAGVLEGPAIGKVLRAVEDWWVDSDFPDDPAALARQLKSIVQTGPP